MVFLFVRDPLNSFSSCTSSYAYPFKFLRFPPSTFSFFSRIFLHLHCSSSLFFFHTASVRAGHGVTFTVFCSVHLGGVASLLIHFLSTDSVALLLGPTLPSNLHETLSNVSPAGSLTEFDYLDDVVLDAAAPSFSSIRAPKTRIEHAMFHLSPACCHHKPPSILDAHLFPPSPHEAPCPACKF